MGGLLEVHFVVILGAAAGTAMAFLFAWPSSWPDFWRRMLFSLIVGVIFGPIGRGTVGAAETAENVLASSAFVAFVSWPVAPNLIEAFRKAIDRMGEWWKPKA